MGLKAYILNRIVQTIVTFVVFLSVLFVLFRLMPGDPTTMYVMDGMTEERRQQIIEEMGLNDPLYVQYFDYLQQLSTGKFGESFLYQEPVLDVMWVKAWNTIFLMGVSLGVAFIIGVYGGAILAWYRGSTTESLGVIFALVSRSIPVFFTGVVLIVLFAIHFEMFPTGGMYPPSANIETFWGRYLTWTYAYHAFLPFVTLVLYFVGVPMLLMRNSMLEILNADFVEMKEAAGLSQYTVLYKHAVRNSILPIVTVAAIVAGSAMGGSVLVETVFNWPGMGRAMVNAVNANDFPLAQATFFIMGCLVILANFVADLLYGYLDPRVSYE